MGDEFTGEDSGDQWQGALDLRAMASEVTARPWPEPEGVPAQRQPARRLRRVGKVTAYLVAGGALFFGGWSARAAVDPDVAASPQQGGQVSETIAPGEGVTLDARWGGLPKRLVEEGVLDLDKFKAAAQAAGMPLAPEQISVLTEGSDEPIRVDANNAYFLLDVLWALGLANRNAVLTEGSLTEGGRVASYASTGGWTLGAKAGPSYVASLELIQLTPEQQKIVEDVARHSYRPCCGNMTGFPDCNHGMAALALAELMASQGATADDIFLALKQISPYWFPSQYHHLALFFQQDDRDWDEVSPRDLMGQAYSSARGFQQVSAQLQQSGATGAGGGAGKASGCAP